MRHKGKHLTSGARKNVKKRKQKNTENTTYRQLGKPSKEYVIEKAKENLLK